MAVRPKLMICVGIAIAGLGLIGAGAGATFTAQVSANTSISSGGLGLSLNGETGSALSVGVDAKNVGSHFAPITKDLLLKNTGTLDMASNYLRVTATGCDGGNGAALAKALHVRLTDVTNNKQVYDGTLCSLTSTMSGQGFTSPLAHTGVGGQLPHALSTGASILYRLVVQPNDAAQGLPPAAQNTSTSIILIFNGFDY
jgi:Camelysin metallo-endopeptidase